MIDDELERFMEERDRALLEEDMDWMRNYMGAAVPDEVLRMTLHKTRYELLSLPDSVRHESGKWLREHGCRRCTGEELLPEGMLPGDALH